MLLDELGNAKVNVCLQTWSCSLVLPRNLHPTTPASAPSQGHAAPRAGHEPTPAGGWCTRHWDQYMKLRIPTGSAVRGGGGGGIRRVTGLHCANECSHV